MLNYTILSTKPGSDYALLDSGDGEKLERYGDIIVARPDPQALWKKRLPDSEWKKAQAYFKRDSSPTSPGPSSGRRGSEWQVRGKIPERWPIELGGLKFWIKLSAFKHTGIFPEQAGNWEWVQSVISNGAKRNEKSLAQSPNVQLLGETEIPRRPRGLARDDSKKVRVLNLFGYTGGASLAAAKAGAEVVHLDGSKVAIGWARDNAKLSGLENKPIRWILDDARAFVKREIKRGNKYDGVIMDPPAFGHGPGGELWKIEEHFLELLDVCKKVLSEQPLFFIINGYASGYSAVAYKNSLGDLMKEYGGEIEIGELAIAESGSERLLPAGIFARWASS